MIEGGSALERRSGPLFKRASDVASLHPAATGKSDFRDGNFGLNVHDADLARVAVNCACLFRLS
jgi:hypothetical protein